MNVPTRSEQSSDSKETRCPVCGPVDGRVPHEVEELPTETNRLALAERYLSERGIDAETVEWSAIRETLDHVANLRRRNMGLQTRKEVAEVWERE